MCHVCRTAAPYAAESSPDDCWTTGPQSQLERWNGPRAAACYYWEGRRCSISSISACTRSCACTTCRDERDGEGVVCAGQGARRAAGDSEGLSPPPAAPACSPARVLRPWHRRGSVLSTKAGPPGAPVTAAGKRAGAALGSCWWSRPRRLRGHCRWSAKCSVMIGGQLVSFRRLLGRSGPKYVSAGSSWRLQLTQNLAAPQTMAPVLQDKPCHSTDLAELCSLIIWSALLPFRP